MIDTSNNLAPLYTPLRQAPQRNVQPVRGMDPMIPDNTEPRRPPVLDRENAEQMLRSQQGNAQSSAYGEGVLGRRAQRALNAYAGQQDAGQREYVSQVLGIDERV